MRTLVHDLKFHDRHDARRLFGRWLAGAGAELLADADALVPVPLTRVRLLSRRFNQSAILAHEIARQTGIKVEPLALLRVRASKPQVGLSREQRRQNVAGAFAVAAGRETAIAGAKLVLVDDVNTTGATAGACARVLKRAGAARGRRAGAGSGGRCRRGGVLAKFLERCDTRHICGDSEKD